MPIPCIENMVAAMGEDMSPAQAEAMLNDAVRRTKQVVADEKIPEWAAAAKVANQMKQEQKLLGALKKRQVAMDAAAQFEIRRIAKTGKRSTWAKNIQTLLQDVEKLGNALGSRHVTGFFADLKDRNALDGWLDRKNHLAIMQELEQLNFQRLGLDNKVGFTGNEQAKAIAEVFFKRRMEIQSTNNRWGAHTEEVPGYIFLQTHSSEKMRITGKRHKLFSNESISESYRVWRESMDTLNIDWGRTVAGEDREQFLKNFHNAVYTNIHGGPMEEMTDARKFKKPGGSLADKLSSQRLLWFRDAESAFKYNELWGVHDVPGAILSAFHTGGRNTAMLQKLGTRPVDNVDIVRDKLIRDVFDERPENAQAQAKDLAGRRITGQMDLLTGKANVSTRPWLSNAIDFVKNITVTGKGGTIILSAFSDKAFMNSRMAFEGLGVLERAGAVMRSMVEVNPRLAAEIGIYNQSLAGSRANRWEGEVKPVMGSQKLLEWVMKYQGINRWTANGQSNMGLVVAQKLASDSHLPWEKLDARRQKVMSDYGFDVKEWEVIRQSKHKWGDEYEIISPTGLRDLPDEAFGSLVEKQTPGQLKRMRDTLEAKLDFYIYDAMTEAVPTPTPDVRSIRTWNGLQRGEWSREFMELAMVFKGFPIKAGMVMARQGLAIGGPSGVFHALGLVAQAGALGYLSGVAKDAIRGRTPKRLFDLNGDGSLKQVNATVWLDAVARGGGLGIFGDLLLSDYERRVKTATDVALGPVFGQFNNMANLFGTSRRVALGEEKAEKLGYEAFRMVENNLPLVGMFPIKSVMEYFVMWHLKEALSPGVFRRTQRSVENYNHQEFFVEPLH